MDNEVEVTFLEDKDIIKSYDEKYRVYLDNINPNSLVELNVIVALEFDSSFYEIYLKSFNLESSDGETDNYTVTWRMSNLNFIDADIPQILQDKAQEIMRDVMKDIFERFTEEESDDECI
jgi:hypothetical protein